MDEKHLAKKSVGDEHLSEQHVRVKRLWGMGEKSVGERHTGEASNILVKNRFG